MTKLFWRQGKLAGVRHFAFPLLLQSEEEVFVSFLLQHYLEESKVPKEILLAQPIANEKLLEQLILEKKTATTGT